MDSQDQKEIALRRLYRVFYVGIFCCVGLLGIFSWVQELYFRGNPLFGPAILVGAGMVMGGLLLTLFWMRDKYGLTKLEVKTYFYRQPLSRWARWAMVGVVTLNLMRACR